MMDETMKLFLEAIGCTGETFPSPPNEEFEYKHSDDAYAVMGRAIRKHFQSDKDIKPALTRTMAAIISDGFLDKIISEQQAMIEQNKRLIAQQEAEIRHGEARVKDVQEKTSVVQKRLDAIMHEVEFYDGKEVGQTETNPALAGAKKAYDWIFEKTKDTQAATKAFNSYLLGGRYSDGDTYDGDKHTISVKDIPIRI